MSLVSLAAGAVDDLKGVRNAARATGAQAAELTPQSSGQALDNALTALTKYIPVEVVALYLAAVSAQPALAGEWCWLTAALVYYVFCGLTPLFFILVYHNQLALARERFPRITHWPWWRIIASTIAFAAWALAGPSKPFEFIKPEIASALSGLAAIFVSTVLTLLGPIVERPLRENA